MLILFVSLRLCSSNLLLSKYVSYSTCSFYLCHLYPGSSRIFSAFICLAGTGSIFRNSFFSGGVLVLSYEVRLHLICL